MTLTQFDLCPQEVRSGHFVGDNTRLEVSIVGKAAYIISILPGQWMHITSQLFQHIFQFCRTKEFKLESTWL